MRSLLPLLSLMAAAQALFVYIDGQSPKCFYEELPKDTLVVGHYTAEEWDDSLQAWAKHDGLSIYISVDVRSPFTKSPKNPIRTSYFPTPSTKPANSTPLKLGTMETNVLSHRNSSTMTTE
jgi:hypothetical protein